MKVNKKCSGFWRLFFVKPYPHQDRKGFKKMFAIGCKYSGIIALVKAVCALWVMTLSITIYKIVYPYYSLLDLTTVGLLMLKIGTYFLIFLIAYYCIKGVIFGIGFHWLMLMPNDSKAKVIERLKNE